MKLPRLIGVLLFLNGVAASAVEKEDLYGTWRLVSDVRQDVATGVKTDNLGKNPHGFLTYGRDGRMSVIVVGDARPKPADLAKLSDADRAALFKTMISYSGTFSLDGQTSARQRRRLISSTGNWTGTRPDPERPARRPPALHHDQRPAEPDRWQADDRDLDLGKSRGSQYSGVSAPEGGIP